MFLGKKIGQVVILFFIEHVKAEIWLFFFFLLNVKIQGLSSLGFLSLNQFSLILEYKKVSGP